MLLNIAEANDLAVRILNRHGMAEPSARLVADHLIDAGLCGHEFSGLARLLAIVEALRNKAPAGEIRVVRENHCSALIDGADNIAYVVSIAAIEKAIDICAKSGVAVVGANNTWFSGRLGYYVERAARRGLIAMHTTNTTARVAPYGGIDRVMGTNPFAIAFPSEDDPLIIDFGTSSTSWGNVVLSSTKGQLLPQEVALNAEGQPTVDPSAALDGAFLPWGGARGSGLSLAIQLLGILAGSSVVIPEVSNYGLFFLVVDPALLMPDGLYKSRVSELRRTIAESRPAVGVEKVQVPGDGSLQRRKHALEAGVIKIDDKVYARLNELAS